MPKLPRAEPQTIYRPDNMPNLVGEGWTAPGRAMQQLGKSIGQLGSAFASIAAEQQDQELHEAKLAQLDLINQWQADEITARNTYTGDGRGYADNRWQTWSGRRDEFMNRWSPEVQKRIGLTMKRFDGDVRTSTMQFGYNQYNQYLFSQTHSAIVKQLDMADPKDEASIDAALKGSFSIIQSAPGLTPQRRAALWGQVGQSLQARIASLPPEMQESAAKKAAGLLSRYSNAETGGAQQPGQQSGQATPTPGLTGPIEMVQPPLQRTVGKPRTAQVKGIIMHQTWGSDTMEGNGSWSNKTGTGAHYYIDKEGKVYQWAPDDVRMAHAGKGRGGSSDKRPDLSNNNTIGIEIMTRPNERPNAKQVATARALGQMLIEKYKLSPSDVVGHGEVAPGHRHADEAIEAVRAIRGEGGKAVAATAAPGPVSSRGLVQYAGLANDKTATDAGGKDTGKLPSAPAETASRTAPSGPAGAALEMLQRQMPVYAARTRAAIDARLKRMEGLATIGTMMDDPEYAQTKEAIAQAGYGADKLAALEQRAGAIARYRQMSPAQMDQVILRGQADVNAKGGRTTPERQQFIDHLVKLKSEATKAINADPHKWAHDVRLPGFEDKPLNIDVSDPRIGPEQFQAMLTARLVKTKLLEQHYGKFSFFRPEEINSLVKRLEQGGPQSLAMLRTIYDVAGEDTAKVLSEVSKQNDMLAGIGWAISKQLPSGLVNDLGAGLALMRGEKFKPMAPSTETARTWAQEVIGDASKELRGTQDLAIRMANLLYEVRGFRDGKGGGANADKTLWQKGLKEVLGQVDEADGRVTFGGIGVQGSTFGFGGKKVIVPPWLRNNAVDDVMQGIEYKDLIDPRLVPKGSELVVPGSVQTSTNYERQRPEPMPSERGKRTGKELTVRQPTGERSTLYKSPELSKGEKAELLAKNVPGDETEADLTLREIAYGLPIDKYGRVVSIAKIRGSRLVNVGDGLYWLEQDDGTVLKRGDGNNYVLNLNQLKPSIRARMPNAVRD